MDKKTLIPIGDMLVDALTDEIVAQGHKNTGKLIESIVYKVMDLGNALQLDLYMEKYGKYVDQGVSADRIPFSPGSGAKTSKYIQALTRWVQQRGMAVGLKKARSIAFAIAKTHKREGMPSRGSYAFSNNGKRTGFFSENGQITEIESKIELIVDENVTVLIDDLILGIQYDLTKTQAA